jgi:hypothetical protein
MGHNSARPALIYQHASKDRERAIGAAILARIEAVRARAKDTMGHGRRRRAWAGAGGKAAADAETRAGGGESG